MPSKSPSSKQAIRLTDLHVGMFVEVNSGDPKNPWWGKSIKIVPEKNSRQEVERGRRRGFRTDWGEVDCARSRDQEIIRV